jgi:vacuolar protein sorting-associated protein 13A/C
MMKGMVTKIIDNLQIAIRNVHVRIENKDLEDPNATFSLGATLQSLDLNTTDKDWKKHFIDRT